MRVVSGKEREILVAHRLDRCPRRGGEGSQVSHRLFKLPFLPLHPLDPIWMRKSLTTKTSTATDPER